MGAVCRLRPTPGAYLLRSVNAIVRMLDQFAFTTFECVFGYEGTLRDIKNILAFQKVVVGDTRAAIMGLRDERHLTYSRKGSCRTGTIPSPPKGHRPRKVVPTIQFGRTQSGNRRLRQSVGTSLFEAGSRRPWSLSMMMRRLGGTTTTCMIPSGTRLRMKFRFQRSV